MVEHPQIHEIGDTRASKKSNASKRKDESNTNEGQKKAPQPWGSIRDQIGVEAAEFQLLSIQE